MQFRGASLLRNSGSGSTRMVVLVCCLISASHDGLPQKPPYANPPGPLMNSMNCALVAPRIEFCSRRSRAAANNAAWIPSSAFVTAPTTLRSEEHTSELQSPDQLV